MSSFILSALELGLFAFLFIFPFLFRELVCSVILDEEATNFNPALPRAILHVGVFVLDGRVAGDLRWLL
jgi:hypothetical protein